LYLPVSVGSERKLQEMRLSYDLQVDHKLLLAITINQYADGFEHERGEMKEN